MHSRVILSFIFIVAIPNSRCLTDDQVQSKLREKTLAFLKSFEETTCADVILKKKVTEKYLSSSINGRLQPLGMFNTLDGALELMYASVCASDKLPQNIENLQSSTLLELTFDQKFYKVSLKFRFDFKSKKKLMAFAMIAFNSQWQICGFEGVVPNTDLTFNIPSNAQSTIIQILCRQIQSFCRVGTTNQQYANQSECVQFLSRKIPFGSYDQGDQNNVICRFIHGRYAAILPSVHCPHLGRTGGKVCTNKSFESYFNETTKSLRCAFRYQK